MEVAVSDILYEHNIPIYEEAMDYLGKYGKVAVVQPTGSGKTYIAMAIMNNYADQLKLVIGPSQTFLDIASENHFWDSASTICLTYQYLTAHRGNIANDIKKKYNINRPVGLIVVDELHRLGATYWSVAIKEVIEAFPDADMLGLTATPIRYAENRDMVDELFDGYSVGNLSIKGAIKSKIFNRLKYIVGVKDADKEIKRLITKYRNHAYITSQFNTQIMSIKDKWCTNNSFQYTLSKYIGCCNAHKDGLESRHIVFVSHINDIKLFEPKIKSWFSSIYPGYNINIYTIHSDKSRHINNSELKEFSSNLKHNEIKVILSVQMMNESFHFDLVKSISIFRETKSIGVFIQQIGRGMSALKDSPYIFDFVDNFNTVGNKALTAGEDCGHINGIDNTDIFSELIDETQECIEDIQKIEFKINNRIKFLTVMMCRAAKKFGSIFDIEDKLFRDWAIRQYHMCKHLKEGIVKQYEEDLKLTAFIDEICGEDWYFQYRRMGSLSESEKASFIRKAKMMEICNQLQQIGGMKEDIINSLGVDFSDCYNICSLKDLIDPCNTMTRSIVKISNILLSKGSNYIENYVVYNSCYNCMNGEDTTKPISLSSLNLAICCRIWQVIQSSCEYKHMQQLDISEEVKKLIYAVAVHRKNKTARFKIDIADAIKVDALVSDYELNDNRSIKDLIEYYHISSSNKLLKIFDGCFGFSSILNEIKRYIKAALEQPDNDITITNIRILNNKIKSKYIADYRSNYFKQVLENYKNDILPYVIYILGIENEQLNPKEAEELVNSMENNKQDNLRKIKAKDRNSKELIGLKRYANKVCESEQSETTIENFIKIAISRIDDFFSGSDKYSRDIIHRLGKALIDMYNIGLDGVDEFRCIIELFDNLNTRESVLRAYLTNKSYNHIETMVKYLHDMQYIGDNKFIKEFNKSIVDETILYMLNRNRRRKLNEVRGADMTTILSCNDIIDIEKSLLLNKFIRESDIRYHLVHRIIELFHNK